MKATCQCGTCSIETRQVPKTRLQCHCTICQAFTQASCSDVAIIPAARVTMRNADMIVFKHYKKLRFPPPNLRRGRCRNCAQPFVETWGFGPIKMLFMRAVTFERPDLLPPVGAHVFYEHHRNDADDTVPRYEGSFDSQQAIGRLILGAL
ncbi:MAG: GFA family protein [Devosia sp.]|nr:GFA family protein [Devosia sp.]